MYVVHVMSNNNTVYALTYKTKSAAKKRYEKVLKVFNGINDKVEFKKIPDNTNILKEFYNL